MLFVFLLGQKIRIRLNDLQKHFFSFLLFFLEQYLKNSSFCRDTKSVTEYFETTKDLFTEPTKRQILHFISVNCPTVHFLPNLSSRYCLKTNKQKQTKKCHTSWALSHGIVWPKKSRNLHTRYYLGTDFLLFLFDGALLIIILKQSLQK